MKAKSERGKLEVHSIFYTSDVSAIDLHLQVKVIYRCVARMHWDITRLFPIQESSDSVHPGRILIVDYFLLPGDQSV